MEANLITQFLIFKQLQIIKKQIGFDLKKTYQLNFNFYYFLQNSKKYDLKNFI